ncbi:MAG: hypothetical protein GY865_12910 [candidate division Zixibacteria bacterium]|nr:hypothetical protein [candidate division Zixibacteria bacterium]
MRCQRVRSFLSAYCKGELIEKRSGAIKAHLEGCPRCRYEETAYREMNKSVGELAKESVVSDDFNSLLFKRVADERYNETRTKAYIPKKIPLVSFNRIAPVVAAACFMFAFVFSGGISLFIDQPETPAYVELDDSYMTVQPNENVHAQWEFNKEVERAARINGLMNQLSNQGNFGSLASSSRRNNFGSPFGVHQFPPMIRTYPYIQSNTIKGVNTSR